MHNEKEKSNMKINPVQDRVLIKPIEPETKTTSGLFIPDNAKEGPNKGLVVSVGPGRLTKEGVTIPMIVSEGNTVMYPTGTGQPVTVDEQKHLILTEDQILAIVE